MTPAPRLANRLAAIGPSATAEVFRKAAELRASGRDVISFAVGEPDFATPEHIKRAAKRAIDGDASHYVAVAGIDALRASIARDSSQRRGAVHEPSSVVVTVGAKHALYLVAQALYDPGDEVIIPTPSWVSYPDQARLAGAAPVMLPCEQAGGFVPRPDALRGVLSPRTKALVLCTPSNPTGAVLDADALSGLAEVALERGIWVIVDEIYAQLTYDGFRQPSLAAVAAELADRLVIVDGVSKTYAMTGWRIGWLIAPPPVAAACITLQSQLLTHPDIVAQHAAVAALDGPREPIEAMRSAFEQRRDLFMARLGEVPGVRFVRPTGAFYVFADVGAWIGRRAGTRVLDDDVAVAEWLLDEALVAAVPGSAFGTPGYLRFSYATSAGTIERGLDRVADAAAQLR